MKIGQEHKNLKCDDKGCQRFGEPLVYSKQYGRFVCKDSLIANGEL